MSNAISALRSSLATPSQGPRGNRGVGHLDTWLRVSNLAVQQASVGGQNVTQVQIDFTNTSLPTTFVDQGGSTVGNVSFIEQVQVVTASSTAQFHLIDGTAESLTVGFPQFTNKFPSNSLGTDSTLDARVASGLTPANSNTEHSFPIATSPRGPGRAL
jgi:hypothetical protein